MLIFVKANSTFDPFTNIITVCIFQTYRNNFFFSKLFLNFLFTRKKKFFRLYIFQSNVSSLMYTGVFEYFLQVHGLFLLFENLFYDKR